MSNEDLHTYAEIMDDEEAASLGRARMADGRRIEMKVEDVAQAVGISQTAPDPGEAGADAY